MRKRIDTVCCAVAVLGLWASWLRADAKVETTDIGLNGRAIGISIAPQLKHVALLAQQGSRYCVYMDGQAGPRIEALCSNSGSPFNAGSSGNWVGQIPVLFAD